MKGPLLLIVLDGWGHRIDPEGNAIRSHAPYFHDLLGRYPNTLLQACGEEVGLPLGVMGNSEVGHMNLGAGRVIFQDLSRIDRDIRSGSIHDNEAIGALMERVKRDGKRLHLFGLLSDGRVHASDAHLRALLKMAAQRGLDGASVLVHVVTDGRDTPPRSAGVYLEQLEADMRDAGVGRIASVVGRFWAMDRDKRWERVVRAYDLLTLAEGDVYPSALEALQASYAADRGDEFVEPAVIGEPGAGRLEEG
ncbi:MAG: 2,3-bisphosphoglycerate-independent phosphoglycerate mutase, partial [Gammaproteobacteria bacterium]